MVRRASSLTGATPTRWRRGAHAPAWRLDERPTALLPAGTAGAPSLADVGFSDENPIRLPR
jgi:hypothetical protein